MLKNVMRYLTYNFLDAIDDDFEKGGKKSWKSKLYCLKIQYFKSSSNIMKDDGGEFYDGGTVYTTSVIF